MAEDWESRWEAGRIGWHQADGNISLREHWPTPGNGERVLVPLCGKSPDVVWLAQQGYDVTGIELSEIAVRALFEEANLKFDSSEEGGLLKFVCEDPAITIFCGDYFEFSSKPFDALYDRASLIALPPTIRPDYIRHTKTLLADNAKQLLITLEYDQSKVNGPPFSVLAEEVSGYWGTLRRVSENNVINNTPPKFKESGLAEVIEVIWLND
jgi:thiopurine S-methyltransferase